MADPGCGTARRGHGPCPQCGGEGLPQIPGRARHAAPDGGPLPAILDEPFPNVPAGHKWDLLDMVERLSEGSQIIYLTDDPYVAAWAKRRSDSGAIKLLAASNG